MRLQATRFVRGTMLLALFAMVLTLGAARAQAQVDPLWDHYKGYAATNRPPYNVQVTLRDQFLTSTHLVRFLDFFANPVEKQHGPVIYPIHDRDLHYAWWDITSVPFEKDVLAINQFGEQMIHVSGVSSRDDTYLLNPALKNAPAGTPIPQANHYKCYSCTGQPINVQLLLTDQFQSRPATYLVPRFFCTPVEKTLPDGTTFPILDAKQHYVVYDMPNDFVTDLFPANFRDQFIQGPLELRYDRLLMVPTDKQIPTPTQRKSWGGTKAIYR